MTSPPGNGTPIVPGKGYTAQTIYQLQNVDPDALGAASNLDLWEMLENFRNKLLTDLLGGFASVPIAILDGIGDVISAITGILHGDFDDLHEWAQNVIAGFGDLLAALQGKYTGTDSFLLQIQKWAGGLFAWVQDVADFVQSLLDAILRGIRGIPVVGGAIADVISDLTGLKNQADTTTQAVNTGSNGQVVSQGLIDGLQYQLAIFTSNGTFTPPTPPSGYEIAYYIGTVYGGGESGSKLDKGDTGGQNAPGGRNGGRASRRLSVAEVGSGVSITVGAGGASKTSRGKGNPGGSSYIGPSGAPLLVSTARTSSIATPFGDLPSSSIPGDGGYGAQLRYVSGSDYTVYPGEDGYPSSKADGGDGGTTGSTWWGGSTTTPPTSGADGTISGDHSSGGGGGGGGGSRVGAGNAPQHGAAGGAPGGGGGGGGGHSNGSGNGGAGGRGQVDILTVFKEV